MLVRAVPRDDVVGASRRRRTCRTSTLPRSTGVPSTVERALDETVGQVQVEEVGVQTGRAGRVVSLFQYRMSNAGGFWPSR